MMQKDAIRTGAVPLDAGRARGAQAGTTTAVCAGAKAPVKRSPTASTCSCSRAATSMRSNRGRTVTGPVFGGRAGFARLAMEHGVPIAPIVTAGAGESLFVISSGERLARAMRLDKLLRLKALPLTVSLPWGLNIGAVGMPPYLPPLPTKLKTRVLGPFGPDADETPDDYAARVQAAMQESLTEMTSQHRPVVG